MSDADIVRRSFWLVLGLLSLVAGLVALMAYYQDMAPRALPRRRRWLALVPKYWIEVPIYCDPADIDQLVRELSDWLSPFGLSLRGRSEERLVFEKGSRLGELTSAGARIQVVVPLPTTSPARIEVRYQTMILLDTGDLSALGRRLRDKQESAPEESGPLPQDTGNPYQPPS